MIVINIELSFEPAPKQWGESSVLTCYANEDRLVIHIKQESALDCIQKGARKIAALGIKHIKLIGEYWNFAKCWHFWLGYTSPKGKQQIDFSCLQPEIENRLQNQIKIVSWVRTIINTSAEELGPLQLAEQTKAFVSQYSSLISSDLITGKQLLEKGYQGIYSVGKGSNRPPVFLQLDYNPTGEKQAPVDVCLVAKGITFDSGGLSIKSSNVMDSMKADMGGVGLATGALALAISSGLRQRVKLYVCCADNLISAEAFKLGDIITYRNGKTVEVMNTDAEGRLVLADGLLDADQQQAKLIIDCATLTGAAKIAVSNDYHTLLTFDNKWADQLLSVAQEHNESFWRLPLAEFHRQQLPSAFADLSNIGIAGSAGASTAAAFLSHFVEKYQQNWLHIDCSATYRKSATDKWAIGATGLGVVTLANLLLQIG